MNDWHDVQRLIQEVAISRAEQAFLIALHSYANDKRNYAWPLMETLCEKANYGRSTGYATRKSLREKGLLTWRCYCFSCRAQHGQLPPDHPFFERHPNKCHDTYFICRKALLDLWRSQVSSHGSPRSSSRQKRSTGRTSSGRIFEKTEDTAERLTADTGGGHAQGEAVAGPRNISQEPTPAATILFKESAGTAMPNEEVAHADGFSRDGSSVSLARSIVVWVPPQPSFEGLPPVEAKPNAHTQEPAIEVPLQALSSSPALSAKGAIVLRPATAGQLSVSAPSKGGVARSGEESLALIPTLDQIRACWKKQYLEYYTNGYRFINDRQELDALEVVASACREAVAEYLSTGKTAICLAESYLEHIFVAFLKESGRDKFLTKRGHPFRLIVQDINQLQKRWDPRDRPPPPPPLPPPPPSVNSLPPSDFRDLLKASETKPTARIAGRIPSPPLRLSFSAAQVKPSGKTEAELNEELHRKMRRKAAEMSERFRKECAQLEEQGVQPSEAVATKTDLQLSTPRYKC